MIDQVFETFRKASESSLRAQQDMFSQWMQPWLSGSLNDPGASSSDWPRTIQRRWLELSIEALNKHREAIDSNYKKVIEVLEQSLRVTEAKSPEDYRRMVDELGRKVFDTFKAQTETQIREFQTWAERSFEVGRHPEA